MAITVKHKFVSAIPDAGDTTIVQPSNWNDTHDLTGFGTAATLDAGVANGVATLDSSGTVPLSQIPALGDLNYQGTWNATTNSPTLTSSVGTKGFYYVVSVAGTTNLNGITDWQIGDWAVFNGSVWQKIDNTDAVTSVNGYTGTVVLTAADVSAIPYTGATGAVDLNAKTLVNVSNLGVNTTTVPTIKIRAVGDNNSGSRIAMRGYSSDANSSAIRVSKFRGTVAAPQAPISGDSLGKFELAGYGTTSADAYPQVSLEGVTTEVWGATARGAKAVVKVTPNTTITQVTALTIDQDSKATFANTVTANGVLLTGNTGTVTSVAATAGTGISVSGSPITTSGTLTITNTAPDQTVAISAGTGISTSGTYPNFTVTNTAPDQTVALTAGTGISTSGTYPNFTITNTAPSSGGTVTSVTGTAPVVSSGGNTPAISIPAATTSVNGYLTSTDWNTFNGKQPAGSYLTAVTADAPLSGSGTSGSHLVIATANTTTTGAISSTDWNTFNGKQAALVSGTNIKTVGGVSLLGAGDVGVIGATYGGTGVNNGSNTLTMAGNVTYSGAFTQTWTRTANTSLTLPISGTVLSSVTAPTNNPVTGTPSSSNFLRGDGTWANPTAGLATYTRTNFTATAGQTSFTVTYTVGYVEVFVNGVLLDTTDYTATSGTAIVLATAAALNDIVTVIAYNATTATTAAGSTTQVQYNSGGNFAGSANLTFDGTTLTGAFSGAHNGTVGAGTPNTGAFTTLSATTAIALTSGGTGKTTAPAGHANLTGYATTATAAGTTTLDNTSSYIQYFTGTSAQTIKMPVTSTLATGWSFHIANNSTVALTLQSSGANTIGTIAPNTTVHITCIATGGTTASDWDFGTTDFGALLGNDGTVPMSAQWYLSSAGSAIGSTIANFFGANSAVSLDASGTYDIEAYCYFLKSTAGTATWAGLFSSAPTVCHAYLEYTPVTGFTTSLISGAMVTAEQTAQAIANMAFAATASLSSAVYHIAKFKIRVTTNAACNFRLNITQSAGTVTPQAGSWYTARKIAINSGTFVA